MSDSTEIQVAEELTSSGTGSGVEAEIADSASASIDIGEPFDPEKIEVQTRQITIDLLLSRIRHKAIDLEPEFQRRRGIWTEDRQSRLIESILLKIPLPTLYAAEDEDENWAIVDGIQRLTTIARFVAPETIDETALLLQGLEYLGKDFSNKGFGDLTPRLKRRLLETELVIHVIRHGTPELVKDNIFARINTGGLPLSRQELRHALNNGKARIILKEWAAFPEFSRATADSIRDERMTDRELVLRFIAFRLTNYQDYRSNEFDRFLSEAMRNLNRLTDDKLLQLEMEFRSAMDTAFQIFGNDAFRKRYKKEGGRSPINKAVFETISVNLAALDQAELTALVERRSIIEDEFIKLVNDRDFDRSVSQGTGDIAKVKMRFFKIEQMFKDVLKC